MKQNSHQEAQTSQGDVLAEQRVLLNCQEHPFVVVCHYTYIGQVAFGVWVPEFRRYLFADGDCYNRDELLSVWSEEDVEFLSWSDVEKRMKGVVHDDA